MRCKDCNGVISETFPAPERCVCFEPVIAASTGGPEEVVWVTDE